MGWGKREREMITLSKIDRKYWVRCMFANEVEGLMAKDGLLYVLEKKDVQAQLDALPGGEGEWFFNETRDRSCAKEDEEGIVLVNPSKVLEWLGMPVVVEENSC